MYKTYNILESRIKKATDKKNTDKKIHRYKNKGQKNTHIYVCAKTIHLVQYINIINKGGQVSVALPGLCRFVGHCNE